MSFHQNDEKWLAMTEPANCPVCRGQPMPKGMLDIVELPNSWLSAEPVDCLVSVCHLTAKRYVIELDKLGDDDLLPFVEKMREAIQFTGRQPNGAF